MLRGASAAQCIQERREGENEVRDRRDDRNPAVTVVCQRNEHDADDGEHEENRGSAIHQLNNPTTPYASAAMAKAPGIVRIQAHTTRPATPQRTADSRRAAPTPTMPPVMVCVVDTGMPCAEVKKSAAAADVSAATPPDG